MLKFEDFTLDEIESGIYKVVYTIKWHKEQFLLATDEWDKNYHSKKHMEQSIKLEELRKLQGEKSCKSN